MPRKPHVAASQVEESEAEDVEQPRTMADWSHPPGTATVVKLKGLRRPVLRFHPVHSLESLHSKDIVPSLGLELAFKLVKTSSKLITATLSQHGMRQTSPTSSSFNIIWAGKHIKPPSLKSLAEHQKINHFPRSYEITRKDRLYINVQRLQQLKGAHRFSFLPRTFLLPAEFSEFSSFWAREKKIFIAKPIASSQGRGIFLVTNPKQVPIDGHLVLSEYIARPLLVEGFKFDLRLYVAVTSYDPIRIYMYEDGLARFATKRYRDPSTSAKNAFIHLTNYSINKTSEHYVACDDEDVEDYGNKWSASALLQHLQAEGVDTYQLMADIEDVIIKTIVAGELPIASSFRAHAGHRNCCFELYGFDILVDDKLKPWLLEVNMSPSLACDAPLDLKIKSHLVADFFNLGHLGASDAFVSPRAARRPATRHADRHHLVDSSVSLFEQLGKLDSLTADKKAVARRALDELVCCQQGGFCPIFPTPCSWAKYGSLLEDASGLNRWLSYFLFPSAEANKEKDAADLNGRNVRYHQTLRNRNSLSAGYNSSEEEDEEKEEATRKEKDTTLSTLPDPLSGVQARFLFEHYLRRLRERMLYESDQPASCFMHLVESFQESEAQLEILYRFLERGTKHLSSACIPLIRPSAHLPLFRRQKLLADSLEDFLHLYESETRRRMKKAQQTLTSDDHVLIRWAKAATEAKIEAKLAGFSSTIQADDLLTGIGHPSPSQASASASAKSSKPRPKHVPSSAYWDTMFDRNPLAAASQREGEKRTSKRVTHHNTSSSSRRTR